MNRARARTDSFRDLLRFLQLGSVIVAVDVTVAIAALALLFRVMVDELSQHRQQTFP